VQRALAAPAGVNRDFSPVLYFYHLQNWLTQYPVRSMWLLGMLVALLGIYLWRLQPVTFAIFAGGFAASALEIVLLLGVQITCGALYQHLGVIVAAFMAGLVAGAWVVNRIRSRARLEIRRDAYSGTGVPPVDFVQTSGQTGETPVPLLFKAAQKFSHHPEPIACPESDRRKGSQSFAGPETKEVFRQAQNDILKSGRWLACLAFAVAGLASVIPVVLRYAGHLPVIVAVTFVLAAVVGMEFPVASRAEGIGGAATASRLYSADLVGACLGAWLASTLLIPLLGVTLVCVWVAGLNVAAGLTVWRRKI